MYISNSGLETIDADPFRLPSGPKPEIAIRFLSLFFKDRTGPQESSEHDGATVAWAMLLPLYFPFLFN